MVHGVFIFQPLAGKKNHHLHMLIQTSGWRKEGKVQCRQSGGGSRDKLGLFWFASWLVVPLPILLSPEVQATQATTDPVYPSRRIELL